MENESLRNQKSQNRKSNPEKTLPLDISLTEQITTNSNNEKAEQFIQKFRRGSSNVKPSELNKLITPYFGDARVNNRNRHYVWSTKFKDTPTINIPINAGKIAPTQVMKILNLIDRKIEQSNKKQ